MSIKKNKLQFWKNQSEKIYWFKKPKKIFDLNIKKKKFRWFYDGKLNACYNVIDKNINNGLENKIAIKLIDEKGKIEHYSYKDLEIFILNFCYYIKKNFEIAKIKNAMIHGSTSLEVIVSMLACSRLGITHCVIFQELSIDAIKKRINLFNPNLFITADQSFNLNRIDKKIFKICFSQSKSQKKNNIVLKEQLNSKEIKFINCKSVSSEKDFFVLFTSGTTGEPKGIVHSLGGYLVYNYFSCKYHFGMNKNTIILNTSDSGWINGHSYSIYGPLLFGGTIILTKKPNVLLNFKLLKEIIVKNKVSIVYLPVTFIRMLKSLNYDLKIISKNLISLGSMGEHLAPNVGRWYSNFFNLNNKAIINTYFQTETGSVLSCPRYNQTKDMAPHGSIGRPHKHLKLHLINSDSSLKKKEFIVKELWPGCMKRILNGKKVWVKYWNKNGYFKMFDFGYKEKINYNTSGRTDDVINIRGHRIGTAEIEAVILKINEIVEAAAIPINDDISGSEIILFVVSKKKNLDLEIDKLIIKYFGKFAIPKKIYYIQSLPKTKSGKIIRRLLKSIVNKNLEVLAMDFSTMLNPKCINQIKQVIKNDR